MQRPAARSRPCSATTRAFASSWPGSSRVAASRHLALVGRAPAAGRGLADDDWALGLVGRLYRTTDGGASWAEVPNRPHPRHDRASGPRASVYELQGHLDLSVADALRTVK